jgi:Ca2+-binding EF-hand superfamily protein
MEYGISLSKEEGQQVLKHFDKDGNGQVDFSEFLSSLGYSEQ